MKILQRFPPGGPTSRDPWAGGGVVKLNRYEMQILMTSPGQFSREVEPIRAPETRGGTIPAGVYAGRGDNW